MKFTSKNNEEDKPPIHIILASQSIGRRHLLQKLSIPFRTLPTNLDENTITDKDKKKMILKRAKAKLDEVINNPLVYTLPNDSESMIIAADSMAVLNKKVFGKANSREEARDTLKQLMGKTHNFVTGVSIAHYGMTKDNKLGVIKRWNKTEETKVTLNKLSGTEVELYLKRYDLSRYAASYTLNETPWDLVSKIDGSYTNVIGLPFEVLLPILRKLEILA